MAERRPAGPPTQNSEAYDLFLKAGYLSSRDTRESRQEAHELLLRAVALDPGFAWAHARLGFIAAHQYFYDEPRAEWEQQAFVSIEKALALDPRQAEAYVARAKLVWSLPKGFQHEAAMRDLLHAIELEPNSMSAHHWLGVVTLHLGLYERAAAEFRLVLRLDPTNTFAPGYLAWIDCELGRPELALQRYERNPKLIFGPDDALLLLGRLDEARRRAEAELATAPDDGGSLARYALVLAKIGDVAKAETMLRRAAKHLPNLGHIHHAEYDLARAYAVLGRKPEALAWLERTARDGMPNHTLFATAPFLTNLRGYSAFEEFLERVKIQHDYYLALIEGRSTPSL
jgi:tetratricopeptide (TPR) repeat protein